MFLLLQFMLSTLFMVEGWSKVRSFHSYLKTEQNLGSVLQVVILRGIAQEIRGSLMLISQN